MLDETLDQLLIALKQTPKDQQLIQVIGDRLEELNHPAIKWWRKVIEIAYLNDADGDGAQPTIGRWPDNWHWHVVFAQPGQNNIAYGEDYPRDSMFGVTDITNRLNNHEG